MESYGVGTVERLMVLAEIENEVALCDIRASRKRIEFARLLEDEPPVGTWQASDAHRTLKSKVLEKALNLKRSRWIGRAVNARCCPRNAFSALNMCGGQKNKWQSSKQMPEATWYWVHLVIGDL